MPSLRNGHAPGHIRETFLSAIDAFLHWSADELEPAVEHAVGYVSRAIPISKACSMVWNCTDIMPSSEFYRLRDDGGLNMTSSTYAACARAMRAAIKLR